MIEIRKIQKSFGKQEVLKDVSVRVEDGQVVVILGPSGSGKTTLLRCINFLENADKGELIIGDSQVDLKKAGKKQVQDIRRKTAFVFQNYNLFANKTAMENVMEGLVTARKIPKEEARRKACEALDWVGLSDKYQSYPSQLSGGQQQRVGIARAFVLHPEVILFDEPTSALDPELVGETLDIIRKVAQTGITMIVVTHEMGFARHVSNHVIFLDQGKIEEQGDPKEVLIHPKSERLQQFLEGNFK